MDLLSGDLDLAAGVRAHRQYLRVRVQYQAHARYDTTVPKLLLILRDLNPARLSDAARAALPPLPQLEHWVARGKLAAISGDWRQYLQRQLNPPSARAAPPASIAAAAVPGVPTDRPVWFATPIHLVAGLDTVRVHPEGLLELEREEQQVLAQDFARVFAGSGWSLHETGRRELLLAGGSYVDSGTARGQDPGLWLGADPREGLPSGAGAGALRGLGAEIEMWLHEHPLNQARVARACLNVTGLWIWGGGESPIARPAEAPPRTSAGEVAWANDVFIDGLAQLSGCAVQPLPQSWPVSRSAEQRAADRLVVCELRTEPGQHTLDTLERRWISPAFGEWRAGAWNSATLLIGSCAVTLERGRFRWGWRRRSARRPWWESLQKC